MTAALLAMWIVAQAEHARLCAAHPTMVVALSKADAPAAAGRWAWLDAEPGGFRVWLAEKTLTRGQTAVVYAVRHEWCHALAGDEPGWDALSPEEQAHRHVAVEICVAEMKRAESEE